MGGKPRALRPQTIDLVDGYRLRAARLEDAEEFFLLVHRNEGLLRDWMPWVDRMQTITDALGFLQSTCEDYRSRKSCRWLIEKDRSLVGIVALENILELHKRAHIGYWLDGDHHYKGVVTQACAAIMKIAFEDLSLSIVELKAAQENHRSRGVAERLGMFYEGTLRDREWLYDHFVDLAIYSMRKNEFDESPMIAAQLARRV